MHQVSLYGVNSNVNGAVGHVNASNTYLDVLGIKQCENGWK